MAIFRDFVNYVFQTATEVSPSGRDVALRSGNARETALTQRQRQSHDPEIPVTRLVRAGGTFPLPAPVEQAYSEPPEPPVRRNQSRDPVSPERPEPKVYTNIYTGEQFDEHSAGRWHIYDKNYYNAVDPSCPKPTRYVPSPRVRDPKSLARGKIAR